MGKDQSPMKGVHDKIKADIERTGRSCLGVFGDPDGPPFTYTIGNSLVGLPELLVIGLSDNGAMYMLNVVSERMIGRGEPFPHGAIISFGGTHPVCILDADGEAQDKYTIQASAHMGSRNYRVQQIVLSDPNGIFPWEPECSHPYNKVPLFCNPIDIVKGDTEWVTQ